LKRVKFTGFCGASQLFLKPNFKFDRQHLKKMEFGHVEDGDERLFTSDELGNP
jgi:hypothetical protein